MLRQASAERRIPPFARYPSFLPVFKFADPLGTHRPNVGAEPRGLVGHALPTDSLMIFRKSYATSLPPGALSEEGAGRIFGGSFLLQVIHICFLKPIGCIH